jgi:hypothetical protein
MKPILVLVALATMLSGCSTTPSQPVSCPTVDLELPERNKPLEAMNASPELLPIPEGLSPEEQARIIVERYLDTVAKYGACVADKQSLIDWIDKEKH